MRRLIARLKLAHKLLLCSAVFSLPVAVLLYYTLSGFQRQIEFTSREIAGQRALRPLCKLAVLLGEKQMDSIAAGVDSLVADIRGAELQVGQLLSASADADLRALKTATQNPAAAENARSELLREIRAALPQLAESTKLILDPNLDSYSLADLALLRLPGLHETLSLDPDAAPDPASLKAVQHSISVAMVENRSEYPGGSTLQANLPPALAAFESAGAGTSRLKAAAALWQTAVSELGVLLEQRAGTLRRNEVIALVLTLAAVGFACALLFLVVHNISVPLSCATGIADQIAAGRLSSAEESLSQPGVQKYMGSRISTGNGYVRDEAFRLLEAFGTMIKNLDALLGEVRKAYTEVESSTAEMAAALRQFEATVAQQSASTTQVAASSKEIFATVDGLAQNMRSVTGMAAEAANLAGAGLAGLNGINAAMKDTLDGAASVSRVLSTISTKAESINAVLSAITKIANHTNLISLNAAIEAEKAGEHAAGFSAVALEIRRVADQTAVAALDIEKMLAEMQAAVNEGSTAMANYTQRSQANSETVSSITGDIGRSIECTRKLEPHFEAVTSGMQMQAQAAREILQAMQQLSSTAGQTRDSLARFDGIAEHVRAAVHRLQSEVSRFSVA